MKKTLSILLFFTTLISCIKEENLSTTNHLSNKSFNKGLRIDGHEFDSLLIENCTFSQKALNIGNANHITIKNCTFENIKDNGIKIGFIGEATGIRIENCTFKNIAANGIDSHENAANCIITNCYFENIAQSDIGAAMGQPHHGIYWKGKNVVIDGNEFVNGTQNQGNAISVRSSGIIKNNIIKDAAKNGIMYFSDHPGGDTLRIENNFIINSNNYSVILASNGTITNHNKNIIIRFNTMVQTKNESIYISEKFENTANISIYGNIIINSTENYFKTFYTLPDIYTNLKSATDIGFVNMATNNLHITNTSVANGYCATLENFPKTDIDNEIRTQLNLDAGADENN